MDALNQNCSGFFRGIWHVCSILLCTIVTLQSHAVAAKDSETCHDLIDNQEIPFDFSQRDWPKHSDQIPENAQVGDIRIHSFPIFNLEDPEENNWFFRSANRLHINTREQTLRTLLLFKTGENYQPRLLAESARLLRNKIYLYDAKVFPFRVCDNRIDVMVVTRDMWTLTPGFSFTRSGGSNSSAFVLSENNFLGRGKRVSIARTDSVDRDGSLFLYKDDNVLGSRFTLDLLHTDNDDGQRQRVAIKRPFYSLDSRWSTGLVADDDERIDKLYLRGESFAQFRTFRTQNSLTLGFSEGLRKKNTERLRIGFSWFKEKFEPVPGEIAPVDFPVDREINYPWVSFQVIEDKFITLRNFNQIYRTEDVNLGERWAIQLGWADQSFGSDEDRLVYNASYRNIWQFDDKQLLSSSVSLNGLWNQHNGAGEDVLITNRWRYNRVYGTNISSFVSLELNYARNLPNNKQLLLGGEQNLRGYPLRYQSGDRRFLLTMEKRFYSDTQWLRLFRVGAAAFVDIGRAWFPGQDNSGATAVLSNIGFGLRIASSRIEKSRVLHIDLAFPVEREDDVDAFQFSLTGKATF